MSESETEIRPPSVWRLPADSGRFLGYAARRFSEDRCPQAAAALTYTSLLALVPLMTITIGFVSAIEAFQGLIADAQAMIFDNLVPEVGSAVQTYLESFVANAGRLTVVGWVGLVITSVLLLATIEGAFNGIWRVRESRPLLLRLLSFWAILTLTPLLFAASVFITIQFVQGSDIGSQVLSFKPFVGLLPAIFEFIGFSALYWIIPNRPVQPRDAFAGGLFAAVFFEISKAGFAAYLKAFPVYETIYGAASTVPIFLVWLYVAWSIMLSGALIAAALPDWRAGRLFGGDIGTMTPAQRAMFGFAVLRELSFAARSGGGLKRRALLRRLPVQVAILEDMLTRLREAKFVERTANDRWLLSRDPSTATLHDLLTALGVGLRGAGGAVSGHPANERRVEDLLKAAEDGQHKALDIALADLFAEEDEPPAEPVRIDQRAGGGT